MTQSSVDSPPAEQSAAPNAGPPASDAPRLEASPPSPTGRQWLDRALGRAPVELPGQAVANGSAEPTEDSSGAESPAAPAGKPQDAVPDRGAPSPPAAQQPQ